MKLVPHHHPLNHTLTELSDWFRDPFVDFEPFSRFFGDRVRELASGDVRLAADLYEDEAGYVARFHLPGASKDNVNVSFEDNGDLSVTYETKNGSDDGECRTVNRAVRRISLPSDADPSAVSAKLEDGVLAVNIKRAPSPQPRTIEVQ